VSTPAAEVRSFAVTIPAGTAETSPLTTDIFFPPRDVVAVRWKVPPGPSGMMGWRLTMSGGNAVIPAGGGWIIADGESATWPLDDQPDSGYWEVTGYNTGAYDHTVYLDFLLDLVGQAVTTPALVSVPPGSTGAVTTPAGITSPAGLTTSYPVSVPVSTPYVTSPPPVSIPALTAPPPVSVPPVSVPPPVSIPPVSVPVITAPPPVTVVQPVFAEVVVPSVTGMRREDAGPVIRQAGLVASFTAATGVVTAQSPAAGALVRTGSTVRLTLHPAPSAPAPSDVVVPDTVGQRRVDAGPVIRRAGLVPVFTAGTGNVIRQSPAAGTLARSGSTVRLTLGK